LKPVEFNEEAEAELFVAAAWYWDRDSHLPERLFDEVAQLKEQIALLPQRFPALKTHDHALPIRHARLKRFPYALVFVELPEVVRVIAFAHLRRRPLYWASRILPERG
jgi:toxin ParE1/3/4